MVPRFNPRKRALVLAALFLAGCGTGGGGTKEQLVRGTDFTFMAPDWPVSRTARDVRATSGVAVVSVTRFELARVFRPAQWAQVVKELDRAAEAVATQQQGEVTDQQTVTIADLRARRYDVRYESDGKELVQRLAFLLRGKTEYLLLCRYELGGDTRACERLLATFRLT